MAVKSSAKLSGRTGSGALDPPIGRRWAPRTSGLAGPAAANHVPANLYAGSIFAVRAVFETISKQGPLCAAVSICPSVFIGPANDDYDELAPAKVSPYL